MRQSRARAEDSRLDVERRLKYLGAARVSLDVLRLYWDGRGLRREPDRNHVEILKECFRKEDCRPLEVRNHVPAIIDQQCLDVALRDSGVSARQLLTQQPNGCPALVFPHGFKLDYLHGLHRIEAAREFLLPTDKWWTVDLYLSDLGADLKTCLIEEYSNEEKPTDGEIYRKIRQYEHNLSFKRRWQARLKGNRAKNLHTLLGDEELTEAFDDLLVIYGLWDDGMMLTTLHKIMAMGLREPILNYLGHIKEFYSDLVGGNERAMRRIDPATVKAIELRAPRASTKDAKILRSQLRGGKIFSAFSDHERDEIWSRLQMFEGLVPSLFTLFRNIPYLQLLADSVRRLIKVPRGKSIIDTLQRRFSGVNQEGSYIKVQITEDTFIRRPGTRVDQIDFGVRHLFAFAMRDYPYIPRELEKQNPLKKPRARADPAVLRRLADLASEVGFESPEISALKEHPNTGVTRDYPQSGPILVTSGPGVALGDRCGTPRDRSYEEDRNFLFLDHLHDERQIQGEGITSFFVRKSVYLAFFGRPSRVGTAANSMGDPPRGSYQSLGDSAQDPIPDGSHRSQRQSMSQFQGTPERLDQERLDQEMQQRLDQERLDQEMQQRLEQEERERRVRKKLDQERLAQAKVERKRRQRDQQEQEKLAQQRLDQERLDQERLDQERLDQERLDQERVDQEMLERLRQKQFEQKEVQIHFKSWSEGNWKALPSVSVHPSSPSLIERLSKKYLRKGFRTFDTRLQMLSPGECFRAAVDNRTHTILLVPQDDLDIDNEKLDSASKVHANALKSIIGSKRPLSDIC
ncbi:hypothetical protein B0J14DRAFT_112537 [Halenospora varia]|nr:hypothetical protein B0J14DRAFT_112537 [Halenospora varia]